MKWNVMLTVVLTMAVAAQADVWRYEVLAADGSNVNTGGAIGAPIVAWNVNGWGWDGNGPGDSSFAGLTWQADVPANVTVNPYGGGQWEEGPITGAAARYSDPELADMMEYGYQSSSGVYSDFRVHSGVTLGKEYRLQILTEVQDPYESYVKLMNLSTGDQINPGGWLTQKNRIFECIFTATEDRLDMRFQSTTASRPWMSGVLLQEVPEPATIGVLALGALALLRRRRR